jgi:hypothetical protein
MAKIEKINKNCFEMSERVEFRIMDSCSGEMKIDNVDVTMWSGNKKEYSILVSKKNKEIEPILLQAKEAFLKMDKGSQFKIFDRLGLNPDLVNDSEGAMVSLILNMIEEVRRAESENK